MTNRKKTTHEPKGEPAPPVVIQNCTFYGVGKNDEMIIAAVQTGFDVLKALVDLTNRQTSPLLVVNNGIPEEPQR